MAQSALSGAVSGGPGGSIWPGGLGPFRVPPAPRCCRPARHKQRPGIDPGLPRCNGQCAVGSRSNRGRRNLNCTVPTDVAGLPVHYPPHPRLGPACPARVRVSSRSRACPAAASLAPATCVRGRLLLVSRRLSRGVAPERIAIAVGEKCDSSSWLLKHNCCILYI